MLEPVSAVPVVIEDDVLVGGNCGVYEGTVVRERAVLAAGVVLTRGTPVFDLVHETVYRGDAHRALEIPAGAVVVPGARRVRGDWAAEQGLSLADSGHRQVPRRANRPRDDSRSMVAMITSGDADVAVIGLGVIGGSLRYD